MGLKQPGPNLTAITGRLGGRESVVGHEAMGPFANAKTYRKFGWRGTLPLPPGAKDAPPDNFTGHGAPYPSDMQVRQWLKAQPDGNICLRLADVEYDKLRDGLPAIYGGNNVDGWSLIGIDVDDYTKPGSAPKNGAEQLAELEAELGKLPATVCSSARWETSPLSGTRLFLVPKGFRFKGKAAPTGLEGPKHIDIIYAGHRYLVVWPSTNPHADGALYRFRYGVPGEGELETYEGEIPRLTDVEVLPVAWFQHLLSGIGSDADAKSELDFGELSDWAADTFPDCDGEPCDMMKREVAKYVDELDDSDSHHPLTNAVWRLTLNALEGHAGWHTAVSEYLNNWWEVSKGKRDVEEMQGEILRSIEGALAKAKAEYDKREGYIPDDKCDKSVGDPDAWTNKFNEDQAKLADADFGGLGPIVGKIKRGDAKPADEYERNDVGNAQHFVDLFGDNIKYVETRKCWILWDGDRWHRDYDESHARKAFDLVAKRQKVYAHTQIELYKSTGDEDYKKKAKAWYDWSIKSGEASRIMNGIKLAKDCYVNDEPVTLRGNILDEKRKLLGVKNGVIELNKDGAELREARKEDYITYNTNVEYIPWRNLVTGDTTHLDAITIWLEYLEKFLEDDSVHEMVQRTLGHMLFGGNLDKKLTFLHGERDTGKSTMLSALQGALGEYSGTINLNLFREKETSPELVRAFPMRLVHMSEADAGKMDVAMVKRLTGGDNMSGRQLYSNVMVDRKPDFSIVVACNNPPVMANADEATNNRILTLPFTKQIEQQAIDYGRQQQVESMSGVAVLSWLVEGWNMYSRKGLKRDTWPAAVRRANAKFVNELNDTRRFIGDYLERARDCKDGSRALQRAVRRAKLKAPATVIDPQNPPAKYLDDAWMIPAAEIYARYQQWCHLNGYEAVKRHELANQLGLGKAQQVWYAGGNARCYVGVRWREDADPTTASGTGWKAKT